jgi:hypothetical protein
MTQAAPDDAPYRPAALRWWVPVVVIDLVLLAATVSGWRVLAPLKLGGENNFATWWSSIHYLLAGLKALELARTEAGGRRTWLPVALGLVLLGFTEIGSIHERLNYSTDWWTVECIAVVFGVLWMYSLLRMFRDPRTRRSAGCLVAGFLVLAASRVQEIIEHSFEWEGLASHLRLGLEEGTELAGAFLLLWCVLCVDRAGRDARLVDLLPSEATLRQLRSWVPLALLAAGLLGYFAGPMRDLWRRGNPAACVPVLTFLALGTFALRRWLEGGTVRLLGRALFLLLASADLMCVHAWSLLVYYPNPGARPDLDVWSTYLTWTWITYAALVLSWALVRSRGRLPRNWLCAGLCAALAVASVVGSTPVTVGAMGVVALALFLTVVPSAAREPGSSGRQNSPGGPGV